MDKIETVPFQSWHVEEILKQGINHRKIEQDAKAYQDRIDYSVPAMSFTLLVNDMPIVSGGVYPLWNGVAEGWVIASNRIFDYTLSAAKAIKKRTDLICINNKIWRLQTAVRADFETGVKFAKWLGLKTEGLMVRYGPDGSNYYKMARIYNECIR